jgi:hypothetical protein
VRQEYAWHDVAAGEGETTTERSLWNQRTVRPAWFTTHSESFTFE